MFSYICRNFKKSMNMVTYKKIKKRADALGISISELARASEVDRQVFNNLRLREPKSIVQLNRINSVLDTLEAEAKPSKTKEDE